MFSSNTTQVSSGGYQISRSLRFNSADTAYLSRTPASAGNRQTWTFSTWFKRGSTSANVTLFSGGTTGRLAVYINSSGQLISDLSGTGTYDQSTAVYRDPSAWYHFVWQFDTTQATAANRSRMYINGVQVTLTQSTTFTQNTNYEINNSVIQTIGTLSNSTSTYAFDGYQTEINFIDGQALTPSSFGETNAQTGVWQPKAYSGSYGTNGFYLNFSDNSNTTAATLGKDYSGNGNNWTPNNFSVTAGAGNDSLVDSPTSYGTDTGVGGEVRGNYCTLNSLDSALTLLNGNLQVGAPTDWRSVRATFGITSGKWYWEVNSGSALVMVGISKSTASQTSYVGNDANGWSYYGNTGNKYNSGTSTAYGSAYSSSDVIGVAFDADAGTLVFYKNNTSQGTAFSSLTSGPYFPALGVDNGVSNTYINFGQRPFAYTAPSGFKALCTQNLPTPTIGATTATQATQYFTPVTYTGTGVTQSVTVGFQPDWVWIKNRTNGANWHVLTDSVRGIQKEIYTNSTAAEATLTTTGVNQFNSSGFQILGGSGDYNRSADNYVAWNWKANGTGASNSAGSITSTVSANTTSGFSIVTFAAAASSTVGHGLGVAPSMVVVKSRTVAGNYWLTYHVSTGATGYLAWNTTDAFTVNSTVWANTAPTSSVFTIGSGFTNASYGNCVAYCFAEVAGYSKFGSYTGNGSSDGPFVYCGFRPAYVLIKRSDATSDWGVFDNKRSGYNVGNDSLYPNAAYTENSGLTYTYLDLTSNGFKIRSSTYNNISGGTYIFMAFAEAPQKFSLAR